MSIGRFASQRRGGNILLTLVAVSFFLKFGRYVVCNMLRPENPQANIHIVEQFEKAEYLTLVEVQNKAQEIVATIDDEFALAELMSSVQDVQKGGVSNLGEVYYIKFYKGEELVGSLMVITKPNKTADMSFLWLPDFDKNIASASVFRSDGLTSWIQKHITQK